ncbi:hypothetical protein Hena1_02250 [Erwinia phage Hena1]|uniref:Uncharacterized protein n=1 Tax=Erwinia phage Hena1 TaxID=2678601 RepID=A0A6B9J616_9CAUD|nr:hypothetical protein HWC84_gp139 [Erwinia phage Hena1]QGZ16375.1 hypothetical protein Hena1_02250 [Erwinia phage Hena1]
MSDKRVTAKVYMRLTVEVHVGNWEGGTDFNSLYAQAQREAQKSVSHICRNTNVRLIDTHKGEMNVHIQEGH